MSTPDFIIVVLTVVASIAAAAGGVVITFKTPRYAAARAAFCIAALCVFLAGVTWAVSAEHSSMFAKYSIAAVTAAIAAIGLVWILTHLQEEKQSADTTQIAAPDIILLSPIHTYKVTWNATSNLEIISLPIRRADETEPLKTTVPTFQIKNIGSVAAKSVTIDWDATTIDARGAVRDSDRLKGFSVKFTDTHFGIFSGNADDPKAIAEMNGLRGITVTPTFKGYYAVYSQSATTRIPYMAPEINNTAYQDAALPLQITELLELYIVASIGDRPPSSPWIQLPPFFATIRWQNPENGKPLRYRIDSRMLSTKAYAMVNGKVVNANASVEAELEFTVAPAL